MHPHPLSHRRVGWLTTLAAAALLTACGGGGTDSPSAQADAVENTATPNMRTLAVADPMTTALATGNAAGVTLATVTATTKTLLSTQQTGYAALKQALFGLNANGTANATSLTSLDWDPSHDSSWFTLLDSTQNQAILPTNWSYGSGNAGTSTTLAVAGTNAAGNARYAAFGGNPFGVPGNASMDKFLLNTVAWLTRRTTFTNLKVVTAHLPGTETYWFPHENKTRTWFTSKYPGVALNGVVTGAATQADNRCDGDKLDACLQGADLLVIGREQGPNAYNGATVMQAVLNAQGRGIPVLYLHHYRDTNDLSGRMLDYFGLGQVNNYWSQNGLKGFNPATLPAMPNNLADVQALVNRLDTGTFTSTWSGCTTSGRISCSGDATYMSQFGTPAEAIRTALRALDANGTAIFSRSGYTLEKLLVLLGDKYRETVAYPLNKATSGATFYRAYFSDMAAYVHRPSASVAKNLGNFSNLIPTTVVAQTRTATVTPPLTGTRDHMTGLYVMPGRTVTLTRTDTGPGVVQFGLNMLRDTTWVFNQPTGLDRPTQLTAPRSPLKAGQTVTITSPYGGPLFLHVDAAAGTVPAVAVQVTGVTTHPVLRNANDAAQVTAFNAELAATPTNWVGITTDTLTLHSTLANFRSSMASYGGNLSKLVGDTWTYTIKDTYELAGFNSATAGQYVLAPAVTSFCALKGWDCTGTQHRRDVMQHVVSDVHAACGNGCSGNPYDQDWAFTPLGWGETHEIGHNLQRGRLNIYAGQSGEVSNNIFPVHKRTQYNLSPAGVATPLVDRAGTGLVVFNALKTALGQPVPVDAAQASLWGNTAYAANNSERVMFYRQLVEHARYYNANLGDGWAVLSLAYLLDRNLDASQATWAASAAKFGFGTYAAAYPSAMSGNDFLLIASSFIIGRDMRPMFDLWGVKVTAAASAQVAAYNFAPSGKLLFPMSQVSQVPAKVGAPIVMSTAAVYPAGY
ncbi:ImpA family metalloprotease [Sphaerotilus sp.]|uniref:ImpA family metalloprotease n=1 Tax=Sphaerotilus sp. TaxID=2093942 RepID=UPI0025F371F0|nr:ImpA family metalloprotease [Sphaerotilus sp.]